MTEQPHYELKIEYLPIEALKPYDKNARKHADADVETIVASIKEFGFDDPIGIWGKDNTIVEGHGRLLAAKKLGMESVPVIRLDHLTDEQRRAYALAHNKTAEMSEWDIDLLGDEILDIYDIDMTQFGFAAEGEKEEKIKPEVEFSEILGEESNYIVLKFTDTVSWLQLQSVFPLKQVKRWSTRIDGDITQNRKTGIGRVVDGMEFLNSLGLEL